eukprot:CAMPEP_0202027672 /NCGR_PEP_ID=MMETSP0905-20130828/62075_1 /ASSEMBLY_ACC=CAM_ASM_000554 /TAXON_ID=420261 /ORGANISM="Thalassiosira antarctica, Strain CCMP982" /LENGTH=86 /DNA_ID=CAMNT_0048591247 /DNA_START=136 /DNA_END=395 /DNA_ORIENTATION=-
MTSNNRSRLNGGIRPSEALSVFATNDADHAFGNVSFDLTIDPLEPCLRLNEAIRFDLTRHLSTMSIFGGSLVLRWETAWGGTVLAP